MFCDFYTVQLLCNEIGHRAVQCKNRKTYVSSSQEKRGMNEKSGSTSTSSNVKAGQAKIHRVIIEARDQPGTNLWGARSAPDILELREPDAAIYLEADRICEEIARKQAMREELNSSSVIDESIDDHITSDSAAMANVADVTSRATSINEIDILSEDAALSITDAMCDDGTKHASLFESDTK